MTSSKHSLLLLALVAAHACTPAAPRAPVRAGASTSESADRQTAALLHALPPKPAPAPAALAGLVGEYAAGADTLIVYEDAGRLHLLRRDAAPAALTPSSRDQFAWANGTVRFTRDADGRARGVALNDVAYRRQGAAGTFRITPVRPVAELRRAALAATPPAEEGDFAPADLVELRSLDPTIRYDIRYATTNNFMGAVFYTQAKAFLQRPAAEALVRAHRQLRELGYGLLIHDAYRPWYVTKMFWDATPASMKDFVADPASGSCHNRGAAVDLTLYEIETGAPVPMVSGYDEFSPRAHPDYPGGTAAQRWHRALLRAAMEAQGFTVYDVEWWHFDHRDWRRYRIGNQTFEEIGT